MSDPGVTIKRANENDVSAIVELNAALFQEDAGQRDPFMNLNWPREEGRDYFTELLRRDKSIGLLAERKGEAVGYLVGYVRGGSSLRPVQMAELESMFVKEEFRSQKVGQQLVNEFTAWVAGRGAERVSVTAYAANEGAVAFYERMGFRPKNVTLEMGL